MNSLTKEKSSRRKVIRYVRWGVKLAFLVIFVGPFVFFTDSYCSPPVYSLMYGGFAAQPLFTVPYGESVCSFLLLRWTYIGPGAWIICPLGGSEVLATAAMEPAAGLDITFLLISVISAIAIFLFMVFLLGAMFCSWVCPVGTVVDGFDKAVERFMPKLNKRREERRRQSKKKEEQKKQNREKSGSFCPTCFLGVLFNSKYATVANGVLVSAVVGSAIFRLPLFCSICPIGALSRGMFHLKAWTNLLGARYLNIKDAVGASLDMPVILEFAVIIPLAAVLLSLRQKRYWCRKICPVGALVKLVSKLNPFIKPVNNPAKCVCPTDYKACESVCPQSLGPQERGSAECSKCFECYVQCKNNNVKIKWFETPKSILSLKRFYKREAERASKEIEE